MNNNTNLEDSFRNDRELVLAAVKENGFTILTVSDEMRNDFEIVKTALQNFGGKIDHEFKYASEELKKNREIVKLAVAQFGGALETVPVEFRDDKELVLLALESVPSMFSIASQRLQKDRQVVLKAISMLVKFNKGYIIKTLIYDLSVEFKNDREIVLEISKIEGVCALKYASKELRNDKQIVLQAVQQNPFAFELTSSDLKNDREFVKEIVKNTPECLEYAPEQYQDDKEIVELALKSSPDEIHYISDRLRNDTEFISKLIGKRGFRILPNEFSNDREIVLESIKVDSRNLERASNELENDREFILQVVQQCGMALEFVKEKFQQDREIVLTAVTQNGNALEFAGEHFFDDKEIILKAAETNIDSNLYRRLSDRLKNDRELFQCTVFLQHFPRKIQIDRQFLMEALKLKPFHAFLYASYSLRLNDRVFAMRIVKRDGLILGYLGSKFRNDREIVSCAVQQNKEAFKFASQELKNDLEILKLIEEKK